jgi:hypothetical protein
MPIAMSDSIFIISIYFLCFVHAKKGAFLLFLTLEIACCQNVGYVCFNSITIHVFRFISACLCMFILVHIIEHSNKLGILRLDNKTRNHFRVINVFFLPTASQ